jgi:multiple sugar transport system permease protein
VSAVAAEATRASGSRRRGPRHRIGVSRWTVLVFMLPWIVGFLAFIIYPMVATLYFSFTKYNLLQPRPIWVGLLNYRHMFTQDDNFWLSVRNTVWIVVFGLPIQVVFAISAAVVLTRVKRGVGVFRTVFFLPTMVPTVAATLGFLFLLNPAGPIDTFLRFLHVPQPLWFQDPRFSKPALVGLGMWGVGEMMIIFLAAMLDVPSHLYEAAEIEGAGTWRKFRSITLPMISPVIFFAVVLGIIDGFQYFAQAYVASGGELNLGQPQGSLLFYTIWLYQQGFQYNYMGYASAMAWVLFLVVMACTVTVIRTSNRWVFYQGGFR